MTDLLTLEANLQIAARRRCECAPYLIRRRAVLLPEVEATATARGIDDLDLLARYMAGVHRRHESGLSLAVSA